MSTPTLYRQHLTSLDRFLADALSRARAGGLPVEAVVMHSGRQSYFHADDEAIAFHPLPHLVRWAPLDGPEHLLVVRPGQRPIVVRVVPRDFWEEVKPLPPSYWQDAVDLREVESFEAAVKAVGPLPRTAFLGPSHEAAAALGIAPEWIEPRVLMRPLDWHRATKTEHEVALIELACRRAAEGHRVGRKAFESGASEREIHWAYLQACDHLERELPFDTIVALDEKGATLHYKHKRGREAASGTTLLLDAGATHDGYAADITRTWAQPQADPTFQQLLAGVDRFQRELVGMVTAGRPYLEIHIAAHAHTARLLKEIGVIKCSADAAIETGLTRAFLPHGVGHHLGIQVHDVGGRQVEPDGDIVRPPAEFPSLRTTRPLAAGHVVTIEPGIYFIPMLLEPLRQGPQRADVDWMLVDRLAPCGGVRIEDDVLCTDGAPRDLTRGLIPGPRGT